MKKVWWIVVKVLTVWEIAEHVSQQANANFHSSNDDFYTASVVEFTAPTSPTQAVVKPKAMIESTLNEYLNLINEAKENGADIIVFPEGTLNYIGMATRNILIKHAVELNDTDIYNSTTFTNVCDYAKKSQIIRKISFSAKQNRIYVLINVIERVNCKHDASGKCANDENNLHSSNLVFDRNGCIVSRYRKFNTQLDPMLNTTNLPEVQVFHTDFNVVFGHFTSRDILSKYPSFIMLQHGIQHVLYPTFWVPSLPFYTAAQLQHGYAYANGIALLAAGCSHPMTGQGGSGIFLGKSGATALIMPSEATQQLMISKVPKNVETYSVHVANNVVKRFSIREMDELFVTQLPVSYSESLPGKWEPMRRVCRAKICCEFSIAYHKYDIDKDKLGYVYRLAIFAGKEVYMDGNSQELHCAIVACTKDTTKKCGSRFQPTDNLVPSIRFKEIKMRMTIEIEEPQNDYLVMPSSVDFTLLPLDTGKFQFDESQIFNDNGKLYKNYTTLLTDETDVLLTFGILGRVFKLDEIIVDDETNAMVTGVLITMGLGLIVLIVVIKFLKR